MAIFNSYVSLPEGISSTPHCECFKQLEISHESFVFHPKKCYRIISHFYPHEISDLDISGYTISHYIPITSPLHPHYDYLLRRYG